MTSFFSVKLNGFEMSLFQLFSNFFSTTKGNTFDCRKYLNLSLKELIVLAKTDKLAKEEFIIRNIPRVHMIIKKYNKKYQLQNLVDLYETGIDSLSSIIESFDTRKGKVDNFITFSIKRQVIFKCVKIIRERERILSLLGNRVDYTQLYKIATPKRDCLSPSKIANYVDFNCFLSKLPKVESKILLCYLRGETLASISKKVKLSICTVSKQLHFTFDKIQRQVKNLDFIYISNNV